MNRFICVPTCALISVTTYGGTYAFTLGMTFLHSLGRLRPVEGAYHLAHKLPFAVAQEFPGAWFGRLQNRSRARWRRAVFCCRQTSRLLTIVTNLLLPPGALTVTLADTVLIAMLHLPFYSDYPGFYGMVRAARTAGSSM